MERLPLRATLTEAVQRYQAQLPALLRVIALPALAYALLLNLWDQPDVRYQPLAFSLHLAVQGLLLTLAALSCHRVILLGPESVPALGASGSTLRDWQFIGLALVLFFVTNLLLQVASILIFVPLGLLKPGFVRSAPEMVLVIGRFAALPALYVTCRYAICLPAIAIDRPLRVKQAWAMTRGHGLRLLLLIGISPWLLHFLQRALAGAFPSTTEYTVAGTFLFWLFLPLEIALLSICYRRTSEAAA